jgi:hypothetical protein
MHRLALILLVLATLACNAVYNLIELEGPEDRATDSFVTPAPPGTPAATPTSPGATRTPAATGTPAATLTPAAPLDWPLSLDQAADARGAMRPLFAEHLARLPDASRYVLDLAVTFDGRQSATIDGTAAIRFTNTYDVALSELYLMLWPNLPGDYLGSMSLGQVSINGVPVTPVLEHDGLAARLPLQQPLAPGAQVEVLADFTTTALAGLERGARFGLTEGVLIAPSFYPLIPRRVNGQWQSQPPAPGGDTTNSDTAFYAYRVSAPADMVVAASGSIIDSDVEGGTQTLVFVTGPMRDLALVVGALERHQRSVDDITLNLYVLPRNARYAEDLLAQAAQQMAVLQSLVGPYPFQQLDIVDAPGAYGGIEYPGLILIGVVGQGPFSERANVHEVGHQWFYSLIGNDQLLEPWLDEGAASYTELLYDEHTFGPSAAEETLFTFQQYLRAASDPALPIGLPIGEYPSSNDYVLIVYGKGALFFDALRRHLGDDVFFAFLQHYYDTHLYGFATSQSFQAAAEVTCACDLQPLFDLWVYEGGPVNP